MFQQASIKNYFALFTKPLPKLPIAEPNEKFNVYSHLSGLFLTVIGTLCLLGKQFHGITDGLVALIYGCSQIFLFFASSFWHMKKRGESHYSWEVKLDQIAIFFAIAGGITPLAYVYLEGLNRALLIGFQWFFALFGSLFKALASSVKRWITAGIYLLMGWFPMITAPRLFAMMPHGVFSIILLGGISYSIGAFFFITKKSRYFHEIFHVLVVLGTAFCYFAVFFSF